MRVLDGFLLEAVSHWVSFSAVNRTLQLGRLVSGNVAAMSFFDWVACTLPRVVSRSVTNTFLSNNHDFVVLSTQSRSPLVS